MGKVVLHPPQRQVVQVKQGRAESTVKTHRIGKNFGNRARGQNLLNARKWSVLIVLRIKRWFTFEGAGACGGPAFGKRMGVFVGEQSLAGQGIAPIALRGHHLAVHEHKAFREGRKIIDMDHGAQGKIKTAVRIGRVGRVQLTDKGIEIFQHEQGQALVRNGTCFGKRADHPFLGGGDAGDFLGKIGDHPQRGPADVMMGDLLNRSRHDRHAFLTDICRMPLR
ncbi:MAG: hypothetical protein FD149_242 [Rhodospirillaceae bacterium]|nr:MAG: hypothetical protein FD149_242 [Rhodospirillaceae bacterium]